MKKLAVIALILSLTGCVSVQKQLTATGGSKADGIVELSFEYDETESPVVDYNQGLVVAVKRCQAWGYQGADLFGGHKSYCVFGGGWTGCKTRGVSARYQCTGKKQDGEIIQPLNEW